MKILQTYHLRMDRSLYVLYIFYVELPGQIIVPMDLQEIKRAVKIHEYIESLEDFTSKSLKTHFFNKKSHKCL